MRLAPETAKVYHIVTDQGNGGAYCSACSADLGNDPGKIPDDCPRCKSHFIGDEDPWFSIGGSDF